MIELEREVRSAAHEEDAVRNQDHSIGSTLAISRDEYGQSKKDQHGVDAYEQSDVSNAIGECSRRTHHRGLPRIQHPRERQYPQSQP